MATERGQLLSVRAYLHEGIVDRNPLMLDALLQSVVAARERLLPPLGPAQIVDLPIPIDRERGIWLVSQAQYSVEAHETRHKHRRAPCQEFARLGSRKITRCAQNVGPDKSYRVPFVVKFLDGDTVLWHARGDAASVRDLLADVHYLGRYRGAGRGRVLRWEVEPAEEWEGAPVLRDGFPLRPLPLDWPGVSADARQGFRVLTPPYYQPEREEPCWIQA